MFVNFVCAVQILLFMCVLYLYAVNFFVREFYLCPTLFWTCMPVSSKFIQVCLYEHILIFKYQVVWMIGNIPMPQKYTKSHSSVASHIKSCATINWVLKTSTIFILTNLSRWIWSCLFKLINEVSMKSCLEAVMFILNRQLGSTVQYWVMVIHARNALQAFIMIVPLTVTHLIHPW